MTKCFVVNEEDMFSDPNFLAQALFPVKGIRAGKVAAHTQVCKQSILVMGVLLKNSLIEITVT